MVSDVLPVSAHTDVLGQLQHSGFCLVNNILSSDQLQALHDGVNQVFSSGGTRYRNSFVRQGQHRFLSFTHLAPHALKIYSNQHLIDLADSYCGSPSHLSNHRIYQNLPVRSKRHSMAWHKDNKLDFIAEDGRFVTRMCEEDMGLILIMYLSDVSDGGLQLIPGTHLYMNSQEVFPDVPPGFRVFTANNLKAGTGILYDYRIIHRAQPVAARSHTRISLFAQMSPDHMPSGEPIVVNSYEFEQLNSRQKSFLGAGRAPSSVHWPQDSELPLCELKAPFLAQLTAESVCQCRLFTYRLKAMLQSFLWLFGARG